MKCLIATSFLLFASIFLYAQPIEMPLTHNPVLQQYAKAHPKQAKANRQVTNTLMLPFFDDFSYEGPYPDSTLWMDNQAYVNPTLGKNPPSVGVATLDGLNAHGTPYEGGENWADTLTSMPIDLSALTVSDNIYMSFFVEPQGNGDSPEAIDVLKIEFKDFNDNWQQMMEISGDTASTFAYHSIFLGSLYLSDDFQFRFTNYNARTGFVDLWHIDYVRIDTDRLNNDQSFGDVCFTEYPPSILRDYRAMPWPHYYTDVNNNFVTSESWAGIDLKIKNHSTSSYVLDNAYYDADEDIYDLNVVNWDNGSTSIPASSNQTLSGSLNLNTDLNFGPLFSINPTQAKINTTYYYTVSGQDELTNQPNFVVQNDTVTTETIFGNYFAYDDGTAESNIGLNAFGSQAAVQFKLNVDDTLTAIQIHIPHVAGDVSTQSFHLKVWEGSLNNEPPVYERNFATPEYAPGLNGFHTYELDVPLFMSKDNNYYIGWQQASNETPPIPVGFDKNNPFAASKNFYNIGTGWNPFTAAGLEGALMIRAVTTEGSVFVSNEEVLSAEEVVSIFPNPVSNQLFFNLKTGIYQDYEVAVYSALGQLAFTQTLTESIPVYHLPSGIYFIKLQDKTTEQVYTYKFVKR